MTGAPDDMAPPDPEEIALLREIERNLAAVVAGGNIDPKVQVVLHYLRDRVVGDKRRDHLQPVPDDGGVGLGGPLRGVP